MNRETFYRGFAERYKLSLTDSKVWCEAFFDYMITVLAEEESLCVSNLGTFNRVKRKEKRVRHPKTGEMMTMPEKYTIQFNVSDKIERFLNRNNIKE